MEWIRGKYQAFTDWYTTIEPWLDGLSNGEAVFLATALTILGWVLQHFFGWCNSCFKKVPKEKQDKIEMPQQPNPFAHNNTKRFDHKKKVTPSINAMTWEALLSMDESPKLDFKQIWKKEDIRGELIKDIISLANGSPLTVGEEGLLIFGISDDKKKIFDISDEILFIPKSYRDLAVLEKTILEALNNHVTPSFLGLKLTFMQANDKRILIISIPAHPYLLSLSKDLQLKKRTDRKGTTYYRIGERIDNASPEVIDAFNQALRKTSESSQSAEINNPPIRTSVPEKEKLEQNDNNKDKKAVTWFDWVKGGQVLPFLRRFPWQRTRISPFITGNAVTPPQFVGRKQELRVLHNALQNGESISLLGKRRIGKSSLLATWEKSLIQKNYTVVLLNGQNEEGRSLKLFVYTITKDDLSSDLSADDAANHLVQWAKKHTSENKKPVILVDECEAIIQQCPHRFWERMRGALGDIIWIFSSKQALDSLYKHYHHKGSPFENQLKTLWLGLLDQDSIEEIIARGVFPEELQTLLPQWAGCHPFYLQLLADSLWLRQPFNEENTLIALDAFKLGSKRHLDDLWNSLSKKEQNKLITYFTKQETIDSVSLRAMGVITPQGQPFADILLYFLKDKLNDSRK